VPYTHWMMEAAVDRPALAHTTAPPLDDQRRS